MTGYTRLGPFGVPRMVPGPFKAARTQASFTQLMPFASPGQRYGAFLHEEAADDPQYVGFIRNVGFL